MDQIRIGDNGFQGDDGRPREVLIIIPAGVKDFKGECSALAATLADRGHTQAARQLGDWARRDVKAPLKPSSPTQGDIHAGNAEAPGPNDEGYESATGER